jgi:hypothetical protein
MRVKPDSDAENEVPGSRGEMRGVVFIKADTSTG